MRLDGNEFIRRAKLVHGDKYDYSFVSYDNYKSPVLIVCDVHGQFNQAPGNHLNGKGCQGCANYGYTHDRAGYLYILISECGSRMKIGITNNPKSRFKVLKRNTPFVFNVYDVIEMDAEKARLIEKFTHWIASSLHLTGFDGCTEWFTHDNSIIRMVHSV
jgi:hypothetical protein